MEPEIEAVSEQVTQPPKLDTFDDVRLLFIPLGVCVLAGDFLFSANGLGVSYPIFLVLLYVLNLIIYWAKTNRTRILQSGLIAFLAILPSLETVNPLTFLIAAFGIFVAGLVVRNGVKGRFIAQIDVFATNALWGALASIWHFFRLVRHSILSLFERCRFGSLSGVTGWIIPIALASIFVFLFAQANPVMEQWIVEYLWGAIDFYALVTFIFTPRFWFAVFIIWVSIPFLVDAVVKSRGFRATVRSVSKLLPNSFQIKGPDLFLSNTTIVLFTRCLVLFNLVFAAQTALDIAYLWGGAALPEGMSYATYAHRGAYPLVAASLLAAAFVLVAMRPDGAGETSKMVKWLVLLWVTQNIALVGSSIFRLDLYVQAYALTYWRLAAFIWMVLVALGLVLIIARFMLGRSTQWLVSVNIIVLLMTLYSVSMVNIPAVITSHNLQNSYLMKGGKAVFDHRYLRGLGTDSYAAAAQFFKVTPLSSYKINGYERVNALVKTMRYQVLQSQNDDWRTWSFRKQRSLSVYENEQALKPISNWELTTP